MPIQEKKFKKIQGTDLPRTFVPVDMRCYKQNKENSIKLKQSEEKVYFYLRNEYCMAVKFNKQRDEFGEVYIEFTQKELAAVLGFTKATVCYALKSLEEMNLIQREHFGGTRADRIYVFDTVENENFSEEETLSTEEELYLIEEALFKANWENLQEKFVRFPKLELLFRELTKKALQKVLHKEENGNQETVENPVLAVENPTTNDLKSDSDFQEMETLCVLSGLLTEPLEVRGLDNRAPSSFINNSSISDVEDGGAAVVDKMDEAWNLIDSLDQDRADREKASTKKKQTDADKTSFHDQGPIQENGFNFNDSDIEFYTSNFKSTEPIIFGKETVTPINTIDLLNMAQTALLDIIKGSNLPTVKFLEDGMEKIDYPLQRKYKNYFKQAVTRYKQQELTQKIINPEHYITAILLNLVKSDNKFIANNGKIKDDIRNNQIYKETLEKAKKELEQEFKNKENELKREYLENRRNQTIRIQFAKTLHNRTAKEQAIIERESLDKEIEKMENELKKDSLMYY